MDSNVHSVQQGNSLIDKLSPVQSKECPLQTHHYNWIVCKNGGMSEEEDGGSESEKEVKKEKEGISDLLDLSIMNSFQLSVP